MCSPSNGKSAMRMKLHGVRAKPLWEGFQGRGVRPGPGLTLPAGAQKREKSEKNEKMSKKCTPQKSSKKCIPKNTAKKYSKSTFVAPLAAQNRFLMILASILASFWDPFFIKNPCKIRCKKRCRKSHEKWWKNDAKIVRILLWILIKNSIFQS